MYPANPMPGAPDVLDADGFRHLDGVPAAAGVQAEVHLLRRRRGAVHRQDDDAAVVAHLQHGVWHINEPQHGFSVHPCCHGRHQSNSSRIHHLRCFCSAYLVDGG